MSKSDTVSRADLHELLRLSLQLHELPRRRDVQVRHLLGGICGLVGADLATMIEMPHPGKGDDMPRAAWMITTRDDEAFFFHHYRRSMADSRVQIPGKERLFDGRGPSASRQQLAPKRVWRNSLLWNEYQKRLDVDEFGLAHCLLPGARGSIGLSIHRSIDSRPFGRREMGLLTIVVTEFGPFFRSISSAARAPLAADLPGQERRTLARLLAGDSEKEAALALGLSVHTVHEYVQALYRKYSVHSRAELLARFVDRCGPTRYGNTE